MCFVHSNELIVAGIYITCLQWCTWSINQPVIQIQIYTRTGCVAAPRKIRTIPARYTSRLDLYRPVCNNTGCQMRDDITKKWKENQCLQWFYSTEVIYCEIRYNILQWVQHMCHFFKTITIKLEYNFFRAKTINIELSYNSYGNLESVLLRSSAVADDVKWLRRADYTDNPIHVWPLHTRWPGETNPL